jgi:V/A-type H+-transporting ATPase subunit E
MSVEKITEKILSDAGVQAKGTESEFAAQVEQIQDRRDAQVKEITDQAREEARRRAEDRFNKDIATAELELRKAVLASKQELIQKVFDRARERLLKMKGKARRDFLLELLLKTVETGDEEIILSKVEEDLIDGRFLQEANRQLSAGGRKGQLRLAEERRDLPGGFVLRRGKQEINCSLAALIHAVRQELEPRVAELLFSESV